jgi:Mycobacterium membrane protein
MRSGKVYACVSCAVLISTVLSQPTIALTSQPEGDRIARVSKGQRVKGFSITSLAKRGWMVIVAVLVVALAGFAIFRLHGIFGSTDSTSANSALANEIVPFNPKQVVLEVFGAPGAVATISYLDVNAQPQQVRDAPLPWSFTITSTEPAVVANVVAQGNGDTIGCRIIVNGQVKDERTVNKADAYTFCLDKSG